jgi:hypothetical protein
MTPDVEAAILKLVTLGMWPDRAAEATGVNKSSMRWHKRRNQEFATAIKKAEAKAEAGYLSRILRHTEKQWTACAWILERRWPERWAKREAVGPTTEDELERQRRLRAEDEYRSSIALLRQNGDLPPEAESSAPAASSVNAPVIPPDQP